MQESNSLRSWESSEGVQDRCQWCPSLRGMKFFCHSEVLLLSLPSTSNSKSSKCSSSNQKSIRALQARCSAGRSSLHCFSNLWDLHFLGHLRSRSTVWDRLTKIRILLRLHPETEIGVKSYSINKIHNFLNYLKLGTDNRVYQPIYTKKFQEYTQRRRRYFVFSIYANI